MSPSLDHASGLFRRAVEEIFAMFSFASCNVGATKNIVNNLCDMKYEHQ
jgi:hypothetical protein